MRTIKKKFKHATSTPKGRIIVFSILLAIVLAIGAGIIYWSLFRKKIIRGEIESMVRNKSNGLYNLSYDSLKLDEVAGNLSLTNIVLAYDSLRYASLNDKNDAPPTLVKLNIPRITVWGVQTPRALLSKEIVGKKLVITDPEIQIIYTNAGKDSARYLPPNEVYRQLLGNLNMIKIDTLEINGAEITTSNLKSGKKNVEFKNTSVHLFDLALDEETGAEPGRILFAKHVSLACEKISFPSEDRPYNYVFDSLSLSSITQTGSAKRIRIIPLLEENAFVKSLPYQDDRFDFTINNMRLKNLDIPQLFNENIFADSILIGAANFKIYRDLSITRDKQNRVGRYPHQLLDKLPLTVNAKTLILSNAFLEYKERSAITGQAGKVQFHQIYATVSNITNDKEAIKSNNVMAAAIKTKFLNTAPFEVDWKFYLQHPKGRFDIKGNMGSVAVEDLSRITEPMGPAKMEKGKIKSLSFNLEGNDQGADGTVRMLYKDLKIALLEKKEGEKELDKKTLASFVANLVVKNDNPAREGDPPRTPNVHFDRDSNRSIFHLVWKTIFKGVKETVGIKK